VNAGSGIGGLVFAQTTRITLEKLGVLWALVINGMVSLAVIVPCTLLLKQRTQMNRTSAKFELRYLRHPGMVWVFLWGGAASESF
jgi:hypothetical protein